MSRQRNALIGAIVITAVLVAAVTHALLRPNPTRQVRVIPVVPVRVMPVPLGQQPIWRQEAETIRIEKMVEAGKAEWERDAAARRGH